MQNSDISNLDSQVKSASTWAIALGGLKLLLGLGSIFILDMEINSIFELNAITIILTIIIGGLMIFMGMRIREGHSNTSQYVKYLIAIVSVSLILGVIATQGLKIAINAWAIYVFIRARKHLKTNNKLKYQINEQQR